MSRSSCEKREPVVLTRVLVETMLLTDERQIGVLLSKKLH
jgi:hypothetical protein